MTTERETRLADKVAVVTGAGATASGTFVGVGQAIASLFARQGAAGRPGEKERRGHAGNDS